VKKLPADVAKAARALRSKGAKRKVVAAALGVSPSAVSRATAGPGKAGVGIDGKAVEDYRLVREVLLEKLTAEGTSAGEAARAADALRKVHGAAAEAALLAQDGAGDDGTEDPDAIAARLRLRAMARRQEAEAARAAAEAPTPPASAKGAA
jgi:predicted transcriptional regulator